LSRALVACALALVVAFLTLGSASSSHADRHNCDSTTDSGHACLLCTFAKSHVATSIAVVTAPLPAPHIFILAPQVSSIAAATPEFSTPPDRGPPHA
jgi:hypothetical protein